ncbi:MAG: sulfite exporter TauE/SafE family protein [Bryobacter sp.]|nr:sulfite exporter TauE/SafE family protein [Bryobacter sp.]
MSPIQLLGGAACAFSVGMAKTGMPGLGILAVPMMVLVVGDARLAAGWLLPILCCADLFAIYYWRRHAAMNRLWSLAPWVLVGIAAGAVTLSMPEKVLRPMVGGIIFLMLCLYLWRLFGKVSSAPAHPVPYGLAAGFATTVANAAGPVMSLYLLSKRLPKEDFVATGAWFFFFINLAKLPIYWSQGLLSQKSVTFGLWMVPAVLAGAMAGRWLVSRIPTVVFEWSVIGLTAASTILLLKG